MWRVLPSTSLARQWITTNRSLMLLLLALDRNIHIPCAQENGKEFQKLNIHPSGDINTVEWAMQQKFVSANGAKKNDSSVSRLDGNSMKLDDNFGSLCSEICEVSALLSPSSELEPTTASAADEFSSYFSQGCSDTIDDGYDTAGLLNTFNEALFDNSITSSHHWISALEQCVFPSLPERTISFRFRKYRLMEKQIGLRQKYLLSKWRLAKQGAVRSCLSKIQLSNHLKPLAPGSVNETVVHETPTVSASTSSPIRRDRFDPLEIRAKVASVSDLSRLTKERDINGLRALLNEYRWPNIKSLRPVINALLKTFVELAADVEEVKQLIWDFAATDNRAYVSDSVTLAFLERIIRENGLQSAVTYAKQHRDLFLVRPPMERNKRELKNIYTRLYTTALENADVSEARYFIDLLVELGYLDNDSEFFVLCISEQLKRCDYPSAFSLWSSNVKDYRNPIGIHLLIRNILTKLSLKEQAKGLEELFEVSLKSSHPYMALGELVVELVIAERVLEAEILMKRLTLSGRHLSAPLRRLKGRSENLIYIERISNIVSNCLFAEKKARYGRRETGGTSHKQIQFAENISSFLISKWNTRRKNKFLPQGRKAKRFKLDAVQLNELAFCIQDVWADIADVGNDVAALKRMFSWCNKHGIEVQNGVIKQCKEVYKRNGIKFPLETHK